MLRVCMIADSQVCFGHLSAAGSCKVTTVFLGIYSYLCAYCMRIEAPDAEESNALSTLHYGLIIALKNEMLNFQKELTRRKKTL